jgi:hypothetical protein
LLKTISEMVTSFYPLTLCFIEVQWHPLSCIQFI